MEITSNISGNEITLTATNLQTGMASTLGNMLRRMFLINDEGIQVVGLVVNDGTINTPFQTLAGVVEDVQSIISNIQLVKFSGNVDGLHKVTLVDSHNESLTASNMQIAPLTLENPEQLILRKQKDESVSLGIYLLKSSGYRSKEQNEILFAEQGLDLSTMIVLDSNHKSIDKVLFEVIEETSLSETMKFIVTSDKGNLSYLHDKVTKILKQFVSEFV